jgi:hypothetical protein
MAVTDERTGSVLRSGHRRRGPARLLAVCAVLGLFLMHGAPASAAEGCSGDPTLTSAVHHSDATPRLLPAAHAAMAHPDTSGAWAMSGAGEHGAQCVAISAPDRLPLPVPALVTAVALASLTAWCLYRAFGWDRRRHRGPLGGRQLLLQVRVART